MECFRKLIWNSYARDELEQIVIEKPSEKFRKQVPVPS